METLTAGGELIIQNHKMSKSFYKNLSKTTKTYPKLENLMSENNNLF